MAGDHLGRVRLSALADRFLVGLLRSLYLSSQRREMACGAGERQFRSGPDPGSIPHPFTHQTPVAAVSSIVSALRTLVDKVPSGVPAPCGSHPTAQACVPVTGGNTREAGAQSQFLKCLQSEKTISEWETSGQCSLKPAALGSVVVPTSGGVAWVWTLI